MAKKNFDDELVKKGTPITQTPPPGGDNGNDNRETFTWSNTGSGSSGGGSSFGFKPYTESQAVVDARNAMNAHNSNPIAAWTGGSYGAALQQAMDKIVNREKFSYDLNADALYQQYKDRYIGMGKMAMQDTMGQASGMTGGYGNSYAQTAGNQAYQGYLQGLNDKVPELYQLAYDKYNQEGENLLNQYNMYNNAYNTEYGQYRDRVNDWYNEANRLSNDYYNAYSQDYGLYSDNYSRALQTAQYNASRSGGSGGSSAKLDDYVPDSIKYDQGLVNSTQKAMTNYLNGNMSYEDLNAYLDSINMTDIEKQNLLIRNAIPYKQISSGNGVIGNENNNLSPTPVGNSASGSQNVQNFMYSVMRPTEFAQAGNKATISGNTKRYQSYNEYVEDYLERMYNGGKGMSDEEVAYLKYKYNLS